MNEKVFFMTKRIILAAASTLALLAGPALAQTVGASGGVSGSVTAPVPALPPLPSVTTPAVSVSGSAAADLTTPPAEIAVTPTASDPLAPAAGKAVKAAKAKKRAR
jgi:hypothetical protein